MEIDRDTVRRIGEELNSLETRIGEIRNLLPDYDKAPDPAPKREPIVDIYRVVAFDDLEALRQHFIPQGFAIEIKHPKSTYAFVRPVVVPWVGPQRVFSRYTDGSYRLYGHVIRDEHNPLVRGLNGKTGVLFFPREEDTTGNKLDVEA